MLFQRVFIRKVKTVEKFAFEFYQYILKNLILIHLKHYNETKNARCISNATPMWLCFIRHMFDNSKVRSTCV